MEQKHVQKTPPECYYKESLTHIEAEEDISSFYTAPVIFIA